MEPLVIGLKPDPTLGLIDFDAATLFEQGTGYHEAGLCESALVYYLRLLEDFAASRYAPATVFNTARCLEDLGHLERAVAYYRRITKQTDRPELWMQAAYRESICLIQLQHYEEASERANELLASESLTVFEHMEFLNLLGEIFIQQNKTEQAQREYRKVLDLYQKHQEEQYLDPLPAAVAQFQIGQIKEARYRQAPLRLPEETIRQDLEVKARLLLEAQHAYLRTIRLGDAQYATQATYKIATLYTHLHEEIEKAPIPEGLDPQESIIYKNLLRHRTLVLLRKALHSFEMSLHLAERTPTQSELIENIRNEMKRIETILLSHQEPQRDQEQPEDETLHPSRSDL